MGGALSLRLGAFGAGAGGGGGGGGGPVSAQHWRILFLGNNGFYRTSIANVQLKDGSGTNLVGSGTASASSVLNASWTADKAFNGSTSDGWTPQNGRSFAWLAYDFGISVDVQSFDVQAYDGGTFGPKAFLLQYSDDGTTWQNSAYITGQTGWSALETRSFAAGTWAAAGDRFFKIEITGTSSQTFAGFGEIRFLDSSDVEISLTGNAACSTSAYDANWQVEEAFDGSTANQNGWITQNNLQIGEFAILSLPTSISPAKVSVAPVNDYATALPSEFELYSSTDAINWTLETTVTTSAPTGGVFQTYTL